MDMASSCNNCSLKEKEQVYTAARDGNLLYLKVSCAFNKSWQIFLTPCKKALLLSIWFSCSKPTL